MKNIRTKFILIAALILAGFTFQMQNITAQESTQCLAVITGKTGNVLLKKEGSAEFVKTGWGTQLFNGDQIRTESASGVNLTFIDGNVVAYGPSATITIESNGNAVSNAGNVKKVTAGMMSDISALTGKRETKKDMGALAGLRSGSENSPIELISPENTMIRTDRPAFQWLPDKPYDRFVVNLYNSKGLLWSRKVTESSMKYPEKESGLQPGETYFWNVEAEDLIDNKKSSSFSFSVLSPEKSKEVTDKELLIRLTFGNDPDSSSLHSFLGAFFMNQGLLEDAINEFEIISKMNPDAALPHEILGSLYSYMGKKDKAIAELQKALELAKGRGER